LEEEMENEVDRAIADEALIHHEKILNKHHLQNVSYKISVSYMVSKIINRLYAV